MKKTNKEIIDQIRVLLNELEGSKPRELNAQTHHAKQTMKIGRIPTGCIGAIQTLVDEGFLDELRTVQQVVVKLREEGQPYSRALVSMNLLNLVKPPRKLLRRVKDQDQWQYILRK